MKLNGELVAFGGIKDDTESIEHYSRASNSTLIYNPSDDAWREGPDMPHKLWGQGGATANRSAYLFGGAETNVFADGRISDAIYKFTPGSGWTQLDITCPERAYGIRACHGPDGMIYVVGGGTGAEDQTDTDRIWRFDPSSESVESAQWATLPQALRWVSCTCATVSGTQYLYTFGGHSVSNGNIVSTVTRYPLSGSNAGTAETMTAAPTEFRQAVSDIKINGKVYICYGHLGNADFPSNKDWKNDVYRYDLANDSWDTNMPPIQNDGGRVAGPHGVFDNKLIVAGGHEKLYNQNDAHDVKDRVDILNPASASTSIETQATDSSSGSGTLEREIHVGFQPTDGGSIQNGLILREGQSPQLIDQNGNNMLVSSGGGSGSGGSNPGGSGSGFESIPTGGAGGDGTGKGDPGFSPSNTITIQSGGGPINSKLENAGDDTLVKLQPGTHRIEPEGRSGLVLGQNKLWIQGQGKNRKQTKLQFPAGKAGKMLHLDGRVAVSNLAFDQSNHSATLIGIQHSGSSDTYQYNTMHLGRSPTDANQGEPGFGGDGDGYGFFINKQSGATARIENHTYKDPERPILSYEGTNNSGGLQAPLGHDGLLEVVRCHFAWRGDHNIYASRCKGNVQVTGGYFHNSCNTNMRIEGKGSWMKDATIHIDMAASRQMDENGDPKATRGLRIEIACCSPRN